MFRLFLNLIVLFFFHARSSSKFSLLPGWLYVPLLAILGPLSFSLRSRTVLDIHRRPHRLRIYFVPCALQHRQIARRFQRLLGRPEILRHFEMMITKTFSLTNFVIGSSALCFQIFVLYPWHEKLEEEFVQLKKEHATLLEEMHQNHRSELRGIREQLELANERRKTGRFW